MNREYTPFNKYVQTFYSHVLNFFPSESQADTYINLIAFKFIDANFNHIDEKTI